MKKEVFWTNRPAKTIRSIYLALLIAALPLLVWNELVQQVNSSLNDVLLWRRGPVHSQAVNDIVLVATDDSTAEWAHPMGHQ